MAEYREFHCPYGDDFEGGDECDRCEQYELCMETYPPLNLIEIPKGATNGDMFEAMFPDIKIREHEKTDICDAYIQIDIWDFSICVSKDWWDEPYKRGD